MDHVAYSAQFIPRGGRVLDIGSGKGKFLCKMSQLGFEVYGVEINKEYIDISLEQAKKEGITISVIQKKAENLPFSNEYFDFVNCAEVSEHVDDPQQMCKEIYRVLKPTGRCYISFHNRFGIYDFHYHLYLINWLPRRWTEPILKILKKQKTEEATGRQKLTTMYYYTYGQALSLLNKAGFSIKDIRIEKIKDNYNIFSFIFLTLYFLLKFFYFNSFHFLLSKSKTNLCQE